MKPKTARALALLAFLLLPLTAEPTEDEAALPSAFVCTQIMGVSVTGDWFGAGFEEGIDGGRWQSVWRQHAFLDLCGRSRQ